MAYLPLSTANLPDPVIDPAQDESPEDYFNTVLYTGTGATQSITGVGFEPDWIWIHPRNDTGSHVLSDVVRGEGNSLWSDRTDAEQVNASNGQIESHDVDGFTVGNNAGIGNVNGSGDSVVAWNWKANGSGVTNTDGSITSTVSANTTSGFSIVSYVGDRTSGSTIGHGLDSKPEFFMCKNRDVVDQWAVYHVALGATKYLEIDSTDAEGVSSAVWNDTEPTSSVITLGSSNRVNGTSTNQICYAFHSVEGFSKFGSYVGNGSSDGPFVYTGFQVRFLMYKNADAVNPWVIYDNDRDPNGNPQSYYLLPNTSDAEGTTPDAVDFLSNGFKIRFANASINTSGQKHIFMAFASNPFKFSTAS